MKAIGIIAEYNPFHNGHIYHLNKVKEMFPEASFDADEKLGKVIDSNNKRREITLNKRLYCFIFY